MTGAVWAIRVVATGTGTGRTVDVPPTLERGTRLLLESPAAPSDPPPTDRRDGAEWAERQMETLRILGQAPRPPRVVTKRARQAAP